MVSAAADSLPAAVAPGGAAGPPSGPAQPGGRSALHRRSVAQHRGVANSYTRPPESLDSRCHREELQRTALDGGGIPVAGGRASTAIMVADDKSYALDPNVAEDAELILLEALQIFDIIADASTENAASLPYPPEVLVAALRTAAHTLTATGQMTIALSTSLERAYASLLSPEHAA